MARQISSLEETATGVYILNGIGQLVDGTGQAIQGSEGPGETEIIRKSGKAEVIIAGGAALSNAFYIGDRGAFGFHTPPGMTAAAIGVQVSFTETGTFQPLYKADSAATPHQVGDGTVDLSSKAFTFPAEVFPWTWAKLWSQNGSGVSVPQASARIFEIATKS